MTAWGVEGSTETVRRGKGRCMEETGFPGLPGKDISQCAAMLSGTKTIGTDDQDSLLHSETSDHTVGHISTHEIPLCALSIESQV